MLTISIILFSIAILILANSLRLAIIETKRLNQVCSSNCQGFAWFRLNPNSRAKDIRAFLRLVHEAFCLDKDRWLRIGPDVKIMDLYRAVTPGLSDNLELEFFAIDLEEKYGFKLEDHWNDSLGFGELYSRIKDRRVPHNLL